MKNLILGVVAATLVAGPLAAATPQRHDTGYDQRAGYDQRDRRDDRGDRHDDRHGDRRDDRGYARGGDDRQPAYRSWRRGQRFDQRYARNYRQIDYRQYPGLGAPPRGYRYVQSGNDAVLVGITSGVIAAVVAGAIR